MIGDMISSVETIKNKKKLEQNIALYSWFKVLTKRIYLPLIAIQLVNVGKVSVGDLAVIAAVSVIVQIVLQIPTGYIADKWGNRIAILIGSFLMMLSPLFYIFMPNFVGGLLAAAFNFGGYTFLSGAIEAFIHDTLIALDRENDYSKVMGKAQSYGLLGNIVLISVVPATYAISHNLPFALGFIAQVVMFVIALNFTFPKASHEVRNINPFEAFKKIVNIKNVALFVFAGVLAGVMNQGPQYRELLFQDIGIKVEYFGFLLALGSVLGAVMGWYIHLFDKVSQNKFYLLDLLFISGTLLLVGISRNQILVVLGFALFAAYSRVRLIIVQAKLLNNLKHVYKATLLSTLSIFTCLGDILAVTVLASSISKFKYTNGYLYFSFEVLGFGLLLWLIMWRISKGLAVNPKRN